MRHHLIFAGTDLADFGVYISGPYTMDSPGREYTQIRIPGRNGDLLGHERRLQNVSLRYPAFCYTNTQQNIQNLRNFLLSKIGYQTLEDDYKTDEFRRAYFAGPLTVKPTKSLDAGNFDLIFNCKPERYLKTGQTRYQRSSTGYTNNPTAFPSKPLIDLDVMFLAQQSTITFTNDTAGTSYTATINRTDASSAETIYLDSETMECYTIQGGAKVSYNARLTLSNFEFPLFQPGVTSFTSSGIANVGFVPRWWRV